MKCAPRKQGHPFSVATYAGSGKQPPRDTRASRAWLSKACLRLAPSVAWAKPHVQTAGRVLKSKVAGDWISSISIVPRPVSFLPVLAQAAMARAAKCHASLTRESRDPYASMRSATGDALLVAKESDSQTLSSVQDVPGANDKQVDDAVRRRPRNFNSLHFPCFQVLCLLLHGPTTFASCSYA